MSVKKDMNALRDAFAATLKDALNGLVDATAKDLDGPVRVAANRLAVAVRNGRTDLADEIKDDLLLRFQQQEIRVRAEAGAPLDFLLTTGVNLLVSGAIAALGSVRVN